MLAAQRPILVATDGTSQSDAALRVAGEISRHQGCSVWVLTVVPPLSVALPNIEAHWSSTGLEARRELALVQAREQVARVTHGLPWPVVAEDGIPARIIADFASDIHAALVVVGMGSHGVVERLVGAATTLSLIRLSRVPVLVATPWLSWPPHRVLAAVDGTPASDAALRAAAAVVAPDGFFEAVTVEEERQRRHDRPVPHEAVREPRIRRVLQRLRHSGGREVKRRVLEGDPVTRLLEGIAAESADLIVTGPRQGDLVARMLRGEVTSTLLQRAPCALLAVPEGTMLPPMEEDVFAGAGASE